MKIKRDADIEYIRENAKFFLLSDTATGSELCGKILRDAFSLGLTHLECEVHGDWWVVTAAARWIESSDENTSLMELFSRIHLNPRAGANAMRSEVLLGAFADRIVVFEGIEATKILGPQGTLKKWADAYDASRNKYGVAFTLPA